MHYVNNWAVVTPMANEEKDFRVFTEELSAVFDKLTGGTAYLIIDHISNDRTLELSLDLSARDSRFITVWAPENKNVVDAYIRGYREAYNNNHDLIIEMDAGMSHDPKALPLFLRVLNEGYECAFGSRFINGGSMADSSFPRKILSKCGTILANIFLGTQMFDMTSGYQGFNRNIVKQFLDYPLLSKAHFYQTEIRFLLRNRSFAEIPIHYNATSPSVSNKALINSLEVFLIYIMKRFNGKGIAL